MVCATENYVEMAEQGWSPDEIELLKKEVTLARETAKVESYNRGDTLDQQEKRMKSAEKQARQVAHDRMHAKLGSMMHEISSLAVAHKKLKV